MRTLTVEQIEDATGLLPEIIAMIVADNGLKSIEESDYFQKYAVKRFHILFNKNTHFRKAMMSSRNRDKAYMFFTHWLQAYLKNPLSASHWLNDSPNIINPSNCIFK